VPEPWWQTASGTARIASPVEEQDHLAPSQPEPGVSGGTRAPVLGESHDLDFREPLADEFDAAVGGAVVDEQDFFELVADGTQRAERIVLASEGLACTMRHAAIAGAGFEAHGRERRKGHGRFCLASAPATP
jgi:hypothetical protein